MNTDLEMKHSLHIAVALLALVALNGCATNFEPKPLPPDHPASVEGEEAPRTGMKRLVTTDHLTRTSKAQLAQKEVPNPDFQSNGMSHDMGNMPAAGVPPAQPKTMIGMDASQMKSMTPTSTASPASKEEVGMQMQKTSDEMKKTSDELKARSDAATVGANAGGGKPVMISPAASIYTCVMHPEVQQPAPGKCPKCGMTLVKNEATRP